MRKARGRSSRGLWILVCGALLLPLVLRALPSSSSDNAVLLLAITYLLALSLIAYKIR